MATYIKGVTDYIPQIQPWSPDYNFYQNTLERKQQSYDRGWEQTNTIYNSILNAPMMRGQNVERRDNFFKEIEGQIQQMSSVDLSLQQNVDAASSVFKPFYENEDIIHDIAYTRKYQDQLQHADYLKNCTDKKKCGGKYWAGGKRLMQYKAQEFINASDEQALSMAAPEFTPQFNLMENVSIALKEAGGFKMVKDEIRGGYNITTTNGEQVIGTLADFITQRFGDNQEFNDYNLAKASLLRYEHPEEAVNEYEMAALRNKAQSQEELDQLIKDKTNRDNFDKAQGSINEKAEANRSDLEQTTDSRAALENKIMSTGILPNSPEDKAYREILNEEGGKRAAVEASNKIQDTFGNISYTDDEGNPISNHMLDATVANAMMLEQVNGVARTLAYKDYSVTKKADPFAVASYSNKLGMMRDAAKQKAKSRAKTSASRIKGLRKQAADHRKYLLKKNFINMKTNLPRKPLHGATPIPGGGMGIGDPADIVAQLDALIAGGYTEEEALFLLDNPEVAAEMDVTVPGITNTGINATKDKSSGGAAAVAIGEVADWAGYNSPTPLKPPTQYTDLGDVKVTSGVAAADVRVAKQVEEIKKTSGGDKNAGSMLLKTTDDFIGDIGRTMDVWNNNAKRTQNTVVQERLNTLFEVGTNKDNPSYGNAKNVIVSLISQINENIESGKSEYWEDMKKPGSTWDNIISRIPGINNSTEYDPEVVRELMANDNAMKDFIKLAGVSDLYKVMTNKTKGVTVRNYENTGFVDLDDLNLINPNEAKELRARIDDKENPLTPVEKSYLDEFDYYQNTPRSVHPLRGMSLASAIPEMQITSFDQLTTIRDAATQSNAAKQAKSNFQSQLDDVRSNFIGEGKTGGKKQDMPALESFLRENIWTTGKNKELGGLRSKAGLYKKAVEDMSLLGKFIKENPMEMIPSAPWNIYNNTIPELEQKFANLKGKGVPIFQDKSLRNLLIGSELAMDEPLPTNLDVNALWGSKKPEEDGEMEGFINNTIGALNPNAIQDPDIMSWMKLLNDPKTQIQRKGNIVGISSPYFTDGKPMAIDLEDVEVLGAYEELFEDIDDEAGLVRAEFMDQADKMGDPDTKLAFPTGFKTNPGNFAIVSQAQEFMITPGDFSQASDEFTPLLQEIETNFDDDFTKYGVNVEQGNKELLQNINRMLQQDNIDGKIPGIHIKYNPVYGNKKLTRVSVEIDPHKALPYFKSLGYGKTGVIAPNSELGMEEESKEKTQGITLPLKSNYYIYNSKTPIVEKAQPNPYYNLVGLSNGTGYSDDTLWEEVGGRINYRRAGDMINYQLEYQIYNYDTHRYEIETLEEGQEPLDKTDWKDFADEAWYKLFVIFQKNQQRRKEAANTPGVIINDISYYQTPNIEETQ